MAIFAIEVSGRRGTCRTMDIGKWSLALHGTYGNIVHDLTLGREEAGHRQWSIHVRAFVASQKY